MTEKNVSSIFVGFALTIAAGSLLAVMDAVSKYLTGSFDIVQVLWGRYFFHTVIMFVLLGRNGDFRFLFAKRPYLQFRRSMMLIGATATMYISLMYIPLANATSIQFFAPVLVTVFAAIFLKEQVGVHRLSAALVGFIGVLVIIQPGFAAFDVYMMLPLATAFMLAGYLIMTRQMVGLDDERCTLFYSTAIGSVLLTIILPWFWTMPSLIELGLMVAQGSLGAIGHFFIIRAFKYAPASLLSPFLYSQLLVATLLSVFYFGDDPKGSLLIGATILVASGLYIWNRERRSSKAT